MAETAVKEKANGIPVPEEGPEEFARMNKMAKIAIPIVLIIFTMGVLPDVYLEVQHPCWSCNSNSSSANASAGVR